MIYLGVLTTYQDEVQKNLVQFFCNVFHVTST